MISTPSGPRWFQRRAGALIALATALIATHASCETEPTLVENPASSGSMAPSIAALPSGGALLSWLEATGDGHALRFSIFDGDRFATPGEIATGSDWFANWADTPRLFVTPGGDWIAHWLAKSGESTYAYDVVASRSRDGGANWSPPVSPHRDGTETEHGFVSYFADAEGTTHLVWLDGRNTGSGAGHDSHHESGGAMTLRTAPVTGSGFGASLELDGRVCDCCQTAAATTDAGPIVIYRDRSEREVRDIHIVRRIDGRWTDPRPVADDGWVIGGCPVNGPDVVADGDRVAAAWFTMADNTPAVRLAVSSDAGASFGPARGFSEGTALGRVQVAGLDDGFLLLWMDEADGGAVLRLGRFDWRGESRGVRQLARLGAGRASGFPRMAIVGDRVLIAWTASERDPAGERTSRIRTALFPLESLPSG